MATGTSGPSGAVMVNSSAEQVVNGGTGPSQDGPISNELRNLVSLLGSQSGNGITLEQLLSVTSSSTNPRSNPSKVTLSTPISCSQSPALPSTPSTSSMADTSDGIANRKRGLSFDTADTNPKRRRSSTYNSRQSGDKAQNKGLRHFSQRVCEKVRDKGTTTYNEVADELVKELTESEKKSAQMPIDQKNIRRRVYDALNVLMAMNIISKEKKEIRWIGLPTNSAQECQHIEEELAQAQQRLQTKRDEVENLLVQILSFKNLMKRNRERVQSLGTPAQNSAIGLPFIIVNTNKKTTIDCSISSDKSEYVFNFDNTFELHNDIDVLKKMGLDCGLHSGTYTDEDVKTAKSMLPKALGNTLEALTARNHKAPGTPQTPIQVSTPATIVASTPNPALLTPLSAQGSPLTDATIVAALAQMKQGNTPMIQKPSQSVMLDLKTSPISNFSSPVSSVVAVSPSRTPTTPIRSSVASPQALSSAGRSPLPPLAIRQTTSPLSAAKNILHSHCPSTQQGALSPLVKVASSPVQASNTSGTALVTQTSKSPGRKIVTVSKLPTPEQISALLQQLQSSPQTATAELSKLISSAANSVSCGQLLNGNDLPVVTSKEQPMSNLTGSASVGKNSQSCLVSNGQ